MVQAFKTLAIAAAMLISAGSAQAALVVRGGGMIYDTELNITWLQDWSYAVTSGYAAATPDVRADGSMTWDAAKDWAQNLVYGGFDDWRLPSMLDTGTVGCSFTSTSGTDCGYNVQTKDGSTVYSELAHLWYVTLGNLAQCPPENNFCNDPQPGWGLNQTGPFINLTSNNGAQYWTGTADTSRTGRAFMFDAAKGQQVVRNSARPHLAVAVRAGDVVAEVPEPQTLALVVSAFGAAMLARRRRPA